MVCYLDAPTLAHGIVVEIDIGTLVEAVVRGVLCRRRDVVVHICEAVGKSEKRAFPAQRRTTYSVKSDTSPCCGGIVLV